MILDAGGIDCWGVPVALEVPLAVERELAVDEAVVVLGVVVILDYLVQEAVVVLSPNQLFYFPFSLLILPLLYLYTCLLLFVMLLNPIQSLY